jgi:hypothetical protein
MVGFALGMVRFGLEFGYFIPPCGSSLPDLRPELVKRFVDDIHYLHYGALLFLLTGLVTATISLLTAPIPRHRLHRLTFWTRHSRYRLEQLIVCHILCLVRSGTALMMTRCARKSISKLALPGRKRKLMRSVLQGISEVVLKSCFPSFPAASNASVASRRPPQAVPRRQK